MSRLTKSSILILAILSGAVFFTIAITLYFREGGFVPTQDFKYPPRTYYISYALMVTCFLWLISSELLELVEALKLQGLVMFIAQNSIWIYLWHIPLVEKIQMYYWYEFAIVIALSTIVVYIQVQAVKYIATRFISNGQKQKVLIGLFTG